jgi:CubicO group peptidase (beta-lactamase class C family)
MTEFSRRDLAGLVPAAVAGVALANVAAEPALAAAPPPSSGDALLPVAAAKQGFTPAQAREFLSQWSNATGMAGGDVSLFGFLNFPEVQHCSVIPREGAVVMLDAVPDASLGRIRVKSEFGDLTLDEYLIDPRTRAQGIVVVRQGRIVFEQYPGMRPHDYKMWQSCTKTLSSYVVRMLAEGGQIDVDRSLAAYLPWMKWTDWEACRVIDALDMRTGMNVVESNATRADPNSIPMRINLAGSGVPWQGKLETIQQVLADAKRVRPPAEAFDYGSGNTLILPMLAEAVTNRRWCDIFQERVWSKMTVEGDLLMGMAPDGLALSFGPANSRLRDLARWGMLYTPSWPKAAREKLVSDAYVKEIQTGGDPSIYMKGEIGDAMIKAFVGEQPHHNHWQWDAVFSDGDFYKSGLMGQGLYVSPETDSVIVFFSTVYDCRLSAYARALARSFRAATR